MHNIKMILLASALSLGTTAVIAQSNTGTTTGKNATGTANTGSSGSANSPANVNSNAAPNAGSPRATSSAKLQDRVGAGSDSKANAAGMGKANSTNNANTGSSGTARSPNNVNSNAAENAGSPRAKVGTSNKMTKRNIRGYSAYARAMNDQGAYAPSQMNDRGNVIVNNRVVGRDPDPRIRFELRRDDPARRG